MKIYGMSGKMGSGKDYIARLISETKKNQDNEINVFYMAFADVLRAEIMDIYELIETKNVPISTIAKDIGVTKDELKGLKLIISISLVDDGLFDVYKRSDNSRRALQYWGTDVRRKQNDNYWTNLLMKKARELENKMTDKDILFITDARFPNEVKTVNELNGKVIRVVAPEEVRIERLKARGNFTDKGVLNHLSETALDNIEDFDVIINSVTKEDSIAQLKSNGII